jgi:hypothetical protein
VERLREIVAEIQTLDPAAPQLERQDLLRDPDRLPEAEAMLGDVREQFRPLPGPPGDEDFRDVLLPADALATRAAAAVADAPGLRYNPLYIVGSEAAPRGALLAALANRIRTTRPELPLAFVAASAFAAELIDALERGRIEVLRARYRRARVLVVDGIEALGVTERSQEELFHLFDELQREGAQLIFGGAVPPRGIDGLEERLVTRLASGLVVELPAADAEPAATPPPQVPQLAAEQTAEDLAVVAPAAAAAPGVDEWFLATDKVVHAWPELADLLAEEAD